MLCFKLYKKKEKNTEKNKIINKTQDFCKQQLSKKRRRIKEYYQQ